MQREYRLRGDRGSWTERSAGVTRSREERLRGRGQLRGWTATPRDLIRAMPAKGDRPAGRFLARMRRLRCRRNARSPTPGARGHAGPTASESAQPRRLNELMSRGPIVARLGCTDPGERRPEVRSYWHSTPRPPVLQLRAEDPVLLFLRPLLRACRGRHPGTGPLAARLVAGQRRAGQRGDERGRGYTAGEQGPLPVGSGPPVIEPAQQPGDRLGVAEIAAAQGRHDPAGGRGAPPHQRAAR